MFKLKNNKRKKPSFFYIESPHPLIGMYLEDYLKIKKLFPLHSAEISNDFAIIQLRCPLKDFYTTNKFYHYGKRLDFSYLKKANAFSPPTVHRSGNGFNTQVDKEGDIPLPDNFNPCGLCKREIECMFSVDKLPFEYKDYDFMDFVEILKENNFEESDTLHQRYFYYFEDENFFYDEMEPSSKKDYVLVFALLIPVILMYLPIHFSLLLKDRIELAGKKKE